MWAAGKVRQGYTFYHERNEPQRSLPHISLLLRTIGEWDGRKVSGLRRAAGAWAPRAWRPGLRGHQTKVKVSEKLMLFFTRSSSPKALVLRHLHRANDKAQSGLDEPITKWWYCITGLIRRPIYTHPWDHASTSLSLRRMFRTSPSSGLPTAAPLAWRPHRSHPPTSSCLPTGRRAPDKNRATS